MACSYFFLTVCCLSISLPLFPSPHLFLQQCVSSLKVKISTESLSPTSPSHVGILPSIFSANRKKGSKGKEQQNSIIHCRFPERSARYVQSAQDQMVKLSCHQAQTMEETPVSCIISFRFHNY